MINLFLRLNNHSDWKAAEISHYQSISELLGRDMGTTGRRALTSPSWIRAVVLRDPLERFISAYLHKAVYERFVGPYTFDEIRSSESIRTEMDFPEELEPTAASVAFFFRLKGLWAWDGHYNLQMYRCGFTELPENFYNRIFVYSPTEWITLHILRSNLSAPPAFLTAFFRFLWNVLPLFTPSRTFCLISALFFTAPDFDADLALQSLRLSYVLSSQPNAVLTMLMHS